MFEYNHLQALVSLDFTEHKIKILKQGLGVLGSQFIFLAAIMFCLLRKVGPANLVKN